MKNNLVLNVSSVLIISFLFVFSSSLTVTASQSNLDKVNSTNNNFKTNSINIEVVNGSTYVVFANTAYTFLLMDSVILDIGLVTKSINFTITEYTENPRTDDGLIEYSLLSNYIHLQSDLPAWDAVAEANMTKEMTQNEVDNLVIGMEKVWFLSYDEGAGEYEAPDGQDRYSFGSTAKTRLQNIDRVLILAEATEGQQPGDNSPVNSTSGLLLLPVFFTFSVILLRKKVN